MEQSAGIKYGRQVGRLSLKGFAHAKFFMDTNIKNDISFVTLVRYLKQNVIWILNWSFFNKYIARPSDTNTQICLKTTKKIKHLVVYSQGAENY